MLIPTDCDVDVAVTVVVVARGLESVDARLVRMTADEVHLVARGRTLEGGARVVVTVDDRTRLYGRVLRTSAEGVVHVSRDGHHLADERAAPRVVGTLLVRWRLLSNDELASDWVQGGPDRGPLTTYAGPADVSVAGMQLPFGGAATPLGARLLLEVDLGGDRAFRAIGVVRRHLPDGVVGVEFAEVDDDGADLLSAFTVAHL